MQVSAPSSTPVRVKICGITRPEDGLAAARLGADAIGLVFHAASPRCVTPARARAIVRALPPFVTTVALFVNAGEETVRGVLDQVPVALLQFHGDETPQECTRYGLPYIKALRMAPDLDVRAAAAAHVEAAGILLDSYRPGVPGGTGAVFDWQRVPRDLGRPVILAGGLDADNVAEAIAVARPYAVDVSGGVESRKGIKDAAKIAAFIARARGAATATGAPGTDAGP